MDLGHEFFHLHLFNCMLNNCSILLLSLHCLFLLFQELIDFCFLNKRRSEFVKEREISLGIYEGRIARDYRIFVSFSRILDAKNNSKSEIISFRDSFINKLEYLQLAPRL